MTTQKTLINKQKLSYYSDSSHAGMRLFFLFLTLKLIEHELFLHISLLPHFLSLIQDLCPFHLQRSGFDVIHMYFLLDLRFLVLIYLLDPPDLVLLVEFL